MATVTQLGFFDAAEVVEDRATKRQLILARLRKGPATTKQLIPITHRFGARIEELRKMGFGIETKPGRKRNQFIYEIQEPNDG